MRVETLIAFVAVACGGCERARSSRGAQPPAQARALASLPYLAEVPVKPEHVTKRGVVVHVKDKVAPGVNLYTSKRWTEARLVDAAGAVVHKWSRPARPLLDATFAARVQELLAGWMHVELDPAGDLLVVEEMRGLMKLDARSHVLWQSELPAHHDVASLADGRTVVLSAAIQRRRTGVHEDPFVDNTVVTLSAKGRPISAFSLLEVLGAHPETARVLDAELAARAGWSTRTDKRTVNLATEAESQTADAAVRAYLAGKKIPERLACMLLYLTPADVLHTNTIDVLPRDVPGLGHKGDFLLSVRNLNLVLIVSARARKVVWHWGPGVLGQMHEPSLLPNGHLLVFDNGIDARRSRILEIDPVTKGIVWSYEGKPAKSFFTPFMGGVQGLANGNVLITDSTSSRAFEVNRAGETVWEFFEPTLIDDGAAEKDEPAASKKTVTIYRMGRVTPPSLVGRSPV
jgi:hypothetical protein